MAQTVVLQDKFLGFQRDMSRDQIPPGYCYDILNMLPNLGVPLSKRGGWSYEGSALTSLNASAGYPFRVAVAPFATGTQVVAFDDSLARIFDVTNSADRGLSGSGATAIIGTPVFYNNLLIWADGTNPPKKYDGAAAGASLGGSPPSTPRCVAVYKDRLLLSGRDSVPLEHRSIYFSAAGNPESWDTANRWLSTSAPIQGLAPLRNSVIVFHSGSVERIRGDIPPGSGAANMVIEPLFNEVGLFSPTSFAVADDSVVWADEDGVYMSDGASLSDLTKQGGIKKYWSDQIVNTPVTDIAVGYWKGYAFISVLAASAAFQDFLMCDVQTRSWYRLSNIRAKNFSGRYGSTDEFYFSNQATKRVGDLSTIFRPSSTVKQDADGTTFGAQIDSAYFTAGMRGKRRNRWVYVTYDIRAASGTPSLQVTLNTKPENVGGGEGITVTSLPETTSFSRRRAPVNRVSNGLAIRISTSDDADSCALYAIEGDPHLAPSLSRGRQRVPTTSYDLEGSRG